MINKNMISRAVGKLADCPVVPRPVLREIIKKYVQAYKIDMSEYDFDLGTVRTFNEFFARKLKTGARVFEAGIVAPAEGFVAAHGAIRSGQLYQVKGTYYSFADLIGEKTHFEQNASYITIYLSPANYHRFHAPFDMEIEKLRYIPGTLHSVSLKTLKVQENLYCENERFVLEGRSPYGRFYYIPVGALVVGRIRLCFEDIYSNRAGRHPREVKYRKPIYISKGEEVGSFEMGSTLVLAMEQGYLSDLKRDLYSPIKLGETLWK